MFIYLALLSDRRFFLKLKFVKRVLFWLTFLLIVSSGRLASKASPKYCISKIKPNDLSKPNDLREKYESISKDKDFKFIGNRRFSITSNIFTIRGKEYVLLNDTKSTFVLTEVNTKKIFDKIDKNFLYSEEWIKNIVVINDGWVYVHADFNNYIGKINILNEVPSLAPLSFKKVPPLYKKRCFLLGYLFGGCKVSRFTFTSDRVFISGYSPESLIQKRETLEVTRANIEKLDFPKSTNSNHLIFSNLPNDSRIWLILKNKILVKFSGKYKTVITIPKSYKISFQLRTHTALSRPLFGVVNKENKLLKTYYIKKVSPTAQCEIMLDPNNPVELTID